MANEDPNAAVIDEFRANGGTVGGYFEGRRLLLLHHRGAKSGTERVNPLAYQTLDDTTYAVFASFGGAPIDPQWYRNLMAYPDTTVEVGAAVVSVHARTASGEERDRIWEQQKVEWPGFAEYEEKAGDRKIPVVILERAS